MGQTAKTIVPIVAANITKWLAWGPVTIQSIVGMNNQGSTLYIQLHQVPPLANGTLANGTVPAVKSLQVLANAPFAFQNLNVTLAECFLAISSTEVNYTAVSAAGGLDGTVFCQSQFMCDGTETVVGDLTTTLNVLQVWTEANGAATPKKLLRLDVTEQLGQQAYVLIEATDADLLMPFGRVLPLAANSSLFTNLGGPSFGLDGLDVMSIDGPGLLNPPVRRGCTIRVSNSVPSVGVPWTYSANAAVIRAIYKNSVN